MSKAIQGAKSKNYVLDKIPGVDDSIARDSLEYATVQETSGRRASLDTINSSITLVTQGNVVGAASRRRVINCVGHGAKKGWFMVPQNGPSAGEEIAIVGIIDEDNFVISDLFPIEIGNLFSIFRPITARLDSDGNPIVTVTVNQAPLRFSRDTVSTEVEEDTTGGTPDIPLPVKQMGLKPVDFIDAPNGPVLNTAINNIPSATFLEIIASTAEKITKVQHFDEIGAFMGLYVGAASSEQLLCLLAPGGTLVDVNVPQGSRISIRSFGSDIVSGNLAINFLG